MRYFILIIGFVLFGCSGAGDHKVYDTPTSGSIGIAVDESLKPLVDAEIKAFEGIYSHASIRPYYVSEAEAVMLLINDSVRVAIITRGLTSDEEKQIRDQKFSVHRSAVAKEGVALIVSRNNPDTLWDMPKLKRVLSGGDDSQKIIFDHQNSGIVRYVRDSLLRITKMPGNSFAAESSRGVIDYVTNNPKAVGLIGASWISDVDDSIANRFLASVKVVGIKNKGDYYQPFQAYIAQDLYPLARDVIINSREARSGLGTGFTSFVAGDKGQRIVLKAGLVPVTMPVRFVEISRESY